MRVLITGGAGFIGSHLTDLLLARGDEVWILDDLSTGSLENIQHLAGNPNLRFYCGSVVDSPILAQQVEWADAVVHLAAVVGVRRVMEKPLETLETNLRGTQAVLEQAAKKKTPVLLASTSEVYGKSSKIPFCEEDDVVLGAPSSPRWNYAYSKAVDECLGLAYWKERGVPVVIARLFNTVGPRQTGEYGMVLPAFVRQALTGLPLHIFGDGKQTRCFGYVGDVVDALARLLRTPSAVGEIFNIGGEEEVNMQELAERVIRITGSTSEILYVPYEQVYGQGFEDMRRRVPCLDKIRRFTGWAAQTSLDEMIRKVVEEIKMNKKTEKLQNENLSIFLEKGPGLRYSYNTWIVAKDSTWGRVLIGGLGALGVGEMWVEEREEHKEYPGYAEAPKKDSTMKFGTPEFRAKYC